MKVLLDFSDDRVVCDADVLVDGHGVCLLAELRVVIVVVYYVHVDRGATNIREYKYLQKYVYNNLKVFKLTTFLLIKCKEFLGFWLVILERSPINR